MARVALVTGSTDGIGRQTAYELATRGFRVIVHGRSKANVDLALAALRDQLPAAEFEGASFDLGSLASVRRGAEHVLSLAPELHVLVNNAGIFAPERVITADGLEATFAVNFVGPFLLTQLLVPRLVASAIQKPSRVVNVSSIAHTRGRIHIGNLQLEREWSGYAAYAQSKLANVIHAIVLAQGHDPAKLVAYSLHPGVIATKLLRQGFGPIRAESVERGARTSVMLASADDLIAPSGSYFSDGVVTSPAAAACDPVVQNSLWNAAVGLVGAGVES